MKMGYKHAPEEAGVSLIELILAVVLMSGAVLGLSLFFPKSNQVLVDSRQSWYATNLATSKIQEIKKSPYSVIPLTGNGVLPTNCDCATANFSTAGFDAATVIASATPAQPLDQTDVHDGISYHTQVCINYVAPGGAATPWAPACPPPVGPANADQGLKNIRVHVTWTFHGDTKNLDMQSIVTR